MLDDFLRRLQDIQRRVQAIDGEHSVPVSELFNEEFMLRHTDFPSINAMFEESGFRIETSEDLAAIPDDDWDAFVANRTRFSSWQEMKSAAGGEWAKRQLGLE